MISFKSWLLFEKTKRTPEYKKLYSLYIDLDDATYKLNKIKNIGFKQKSINAVEDEIQLLQDKIDRYKKSYPELKKLVWKNKKLS